MTQERAKATRYVASDAFCRSYVYFEHLKLWELDESLEARLPGKYDKGTTPITDYKFKSISGELDCDTDILFSYSKGMERMLSQNDAGCPVIWKSKLQTEIALSTAEAEYIALSQATRQVIPLMNVMAEISCVFDEIYMPKPQVKCKVFEDNRSCIAIAESSEVTPRTKHIALKYHHFRSFIKNKALEIFPIDTEEQTADIFTKPLDEKTFLYLRKKLSSW